MSERPPIDLPESELVVVESSRGSVTGVSLVWRGWVVLCRRLGGWVLTPSVRMGYILQIEQLTAELSQVKLEKVREVHRWKSQCEAAQLEAETLTALHIRLTARVQAETEAIQVARRDLKSGGV